MFRKIKSKPWSEDLLKSIVCLIGAIYFIVFYKDYSSKLATLKSEAIEKYSCSDVNFEYNEDMNSDMPLGYVIVCKTFTDDYKLEVEYEFDKKGKEWYQEAMTYNLIRYSSGFLAVALLGLSGFFAYFVANSIISNKKHDKEDREDKINESKDFIIRS